VHADKLEITDITMKAFVRAAPLTVDLFKVTEHRNLVMDKLFEAVKI
jgi:hypothetical protein